MKKFSKILIANRGEIALRIIRAAREIGILTVGIYAEGEEDALHVVRSDETFSLGGSDLADTYLNAEKIINAAIRTGAEAIHPGYGFLSEDPGFAEKCEQAGIVFIGPPVSVLKLTGNKLSAKALASEAGVNVLPDCLVCLSEVVQLASNLTYPFMIKASYGGGGKGMQLVEGAGQLSELVRSAARSAKNYFGNGELFLEKYIPSARHIEVQILGDQQGNIVHLFERDCSVQRKHQKIVEEAPAVSVSEELRHALHQAALKIAGKVGYTNAGTVEFLVDENEQFWFLEINPRIQVEHPVSEQITGIDIVKEQLSVAAGNPLSFSQNEITVKGYAMESRIYAEDPLNGFATSGQVVQAFKFPGYHWVRIESALKVNSGNTLSFDPLLCKVIVSGTNREDVRDKMVVALSETAILGPQTNLPFIMEIIRGDHFCTNSVTTDYCSVFQSDLILKVRKTEASVNRRFIIAAALAELFGHVEESGSVWQRIGFWRIDQQVELIVDSQRLKARFSKDRNIFRVKTGNIDFSDRLSFGKEGLADILVGNVSKKVLISRQSGSSLLIGMDGFSFAVGSTDFPDYYSNRNFSKNSSSVAGENLVKSPLYGKIISIHVEKDQTVDKGDLLLVIESMKSENTVVSPRKCRIKEIMVDIGEQVSYHKPLVCLEEN